MPLPTRVIGGRPVSAFGLGGAAWSLKPDTDRQAALGTIRAALEAGITLLDTATSYTPPNDPGHNERLFARAVSDFAGDGILVASKAGQTRDGNTFPIDGRPTTLKRQCEASLTALGVERIDLYYLHHPDPAVPIEDSVGALAELKAEGKIDLIGISNVDRSMAERALATAPISAVQNKLSPFDLEHLDLLAWCAGRGIAFVAYSPLGGWEHPVYPTALPALSAIAAAHGASPEQVALAWELSLAPALIPILGSTRPATLTNSIAAADISLSAADIITIEHGIRTRTA